MVDAAAKAFTRPYPKRGSQPGTPRLSTVEASRFQISSLFENRWDPQARAAIPATCGQAMLVPLIVVVPPPSLSDRMFTPGAHRSTSGPRLLNGAITLDESIADTAITFLYFAGKPTLDVAGGTGDPAFPAAATSNKPLLQAVLQMVCSAAGADPPPKLM